MPVSFKHLSSCQTFWINTYAIKGRYTISKAAYFLAKLYFADRKEIFSKKKKPPTNTCSSFFFGLNVENIYGNFCLTLTLIHLVPHKSTKLCFYKNLNCTKLEFFFSFYILACTTDRAYFSQSNVVDSCNAQRRHQRLFGWDSKRETGTSWEAKSWGRKVRQRLWSRGKLGAFAHLWVGERMSKRMPVMQTDIPADGSFYSKDTS